MKRPRKLSYQALTQRLTAVEYELFGYRQQIATVSKDRDSWKATAQARIDTAMMDSRIRLASALGQMTDALSHAIVTVIAKKTL